jgi:hypothetical protein
MISTAMIKERDREASLDRSEINASFDMIGFNGMDKDDEHGKREKYLEFDCPV